MALLLIRHGQTDWNAEKRIQGRTDIPLNENGLAQANRLALDLVSGDKRPVSVYTSKLLRASQTAEVLACALQVPLFYVDNLEELGFGVFEGLTYAEARERYPDAYAGQIAGGDGAAAPEGEPVRDMLKRVVAVLLEIAAIETGRLAAVVTHGAVIRHLTNLILMQRSETDLEFGMENGASFLVTEEALLQVAEKIGVA